MSVVFILDVNIYIPENRDSITSHVSRMTSVSRKYVFLNTQLIWSNSTLNERKKAYTQAIQPTESKQKEENRSIIIVDNLKKKSMLATRQMRRQTNAVWIALSSF